MSTTAVEIPLFDPSAIEKIRAVAGEKASDFVAEMAQLFIDEGDKAMASLRLATESANWKTVSKVSHSLKSSSATLGLMLLSNACRELELNTKNAASAAETPQLAEQVFAQYEQAVPVLKSLL